MIEPFPQYLLFSHPPLSNVKAKTKKFHLIPNSVFPVVFFHCLEGDGKQNTDSRASSWCAGTCESGKQPKQNNRIPLCNTEMLQCPYSVWLHGLSLIKTGVKNPPTPIQSATPTTLTNVAIAIEPLSTIMYMEHLPKVAQEYKAPSNPNWEF